MGSDMDLLELANEIGLTPVKVSQTYGGEYACYCPKCGDSGKGTQSDRFRLWPNQKTKNYCGRYWCRQCRIGGDTLQFCKDFLGLSYVEACNRLRITPSYSQRYRVIDLKKTKVEFLETTPPNHIWQQKAAAFVDICHQRLFSYPASIALLNERGFNENSIRHWKFGYCWEPFWRERTSWGLPEIIKSNGHKTTLWLPQGIVIPTYLKCDVIKIKIRRPDHIKLQPHEKFQKYVVVSGSLDTPAIYGNENKPFLIIESEFDAMLMHEIVGDVCCIIALGGAQKRPDVNLHKLLGNASRILLALDFDEGGIKANHFWRSLYPQLRIWPIPKGKSPGDAFKLGIDLRKWIQAGLS